VSREHDTLAFTTVRVAQPNPHVSSTHIAGFLQTKALERILRLLDHPHKGRRSGVSVMRSLVTAALPATTVTALAMRSLALRLTNAVRQTTAIMIGGTNAWPKIDTILSSKQLHLETTLTRTRLKTNGTTHGNRSI